MKSILGTLACISVFAVASYASTLTFLGSLGPEVPGATGTGSVVVVHDMDAHTLSIDTVFSGVSSPTTVAHIHCCTAMPGTGTVGVAVTPGTLPGFPAGVLAGTYMAVIDLSDPANFTGTFREGGVLTAAEAEQKLLTGMLEGRAYFNIHSNAFPGGEIRDFLQVVPEPGTVALLGGALVGLVLLRRRQGA